MGSTKLDSWAELLLDTGKRNNLINFKESKAGTVEIISPEFSVFFNKIEGGKRFEVYDPKTNNDLDEDIFKLNSDTEEKVVPTKKEYYDAYVNKINKNSQILIYNPTFAPIKALKTIHKRAKTAIEETGVNIAYIAFGFIKWNDKEIPQTNYKAPILLVPITFENQSQIDPYYITVADDDIIVNPTFSFKLQSEYGIKLPDYQDEGIDEYLAKIEKLFTKLNWQIIKECKLGIFSFLKINMYRDLKDNSKAIVNHKVVKALMGESSPLTVDVNEYTKGDVLDLHNVVDADSSQAEATWLAKSGKSFVLQGPPGTGKSQTITNIIAECLNDGKKVLFVSEKLAALNVVYDKLKTAGLSEFCLQLHSHKANKKAVIEDLCHTLKLGRSGVSAKAATEIALRKKYQKQLDEYVELLHAENPVINKTLYNLYEELSSCRNAKPIKYAISDIDKKGESYVAEVINLLEDYEKYAVEIGSDYHKNVWYGYDKTEISYQTQIRIEEDLKDFLTFISSLIEVRSEISTEFKIDCSNINVLTECLKLFEILKDSKYILPELLNKNVLDKAIQTLEKMAIQAKSVLAQKRSVERTFDLDVYKLDASLYHKKLTRQFTGFFSRLFNKEYKSIITDLRLSKLNGKRVSYSEAVYTCSALKTISENESKFNKLENDVKHLMGDGYVGIETNFEEVLQEFKKVYAILSTGLNCNSFAPTKKEDFIPKQLKAGEIFSKLTALFEKHIDAKIRLYADFNSEKIDFNRKELTTLHKKVQGCLTSIDKLESICRFNVLLNKLDGLGAKAYVDYTISESLPTSQVVVTYKKAFYTQWVDFIIRKNPTLHEFSRIAQDKAVELFSSKDTLQFEINKADIKAHLSTLRPSLDLVAGGSSISILLREGEKKRKQKGIRVLLSEISDLVQLLKPCFLMSPLSVSTFLDSNNIVFDTVIFDEASQIFPQDAVGAIYRGKQIIVVGDSKQMPPSNFFNSTVENEDDEEGITDYESILDLCSTSLTQLRLKWHYRSRFEPLIAFSNKNFYDNELVTFPSAKEDQDGIGVDYHYVDGVFDHKTRTNVKEAEEIVKLIFENIEKYPDRSLGVVAFSISQQDLIERLLNKRRQIDTSKESFFKGDADEPFFIKNLETVQGDERDTIIFSVAYGKDENGKLLHNFGPLNRDGGERRLNVAITRAKCNVQLVSSMHYYDIDLKRTNSLGAKLLREYLDYAENGNIALEREDNENVFEKEESEFVLEVYDFLVEKGYTVERKVGFSSFKIDLAVKSPKGADYLLAIECDGESYRSTKNTRDRDRLRREVLEKMGWSFYRIWSTDWVRNNSIEKEKLLQAIKDASSKKWTATKNPNEVTATSFEESVATLHFEFPKYEMVDVSDVKFTTVQNRINTIAKILEKEAPISEEWILKRVCHLYGREKVTLVVKEEFYKDVNSLKTIKVEEINGFLYLAGKEVPKLRVPNKNDTPRDVKYICTEELTSGLYELLKNNVTVDKEGLFKTFAGLLGFSRIGDYMHTRFEFALIMLSGKIQNKGDVISVKK